MPAPEIHIVSSGNGITPRKRPKPSQPTQSRKQLRTQNDPIDRLPSSNNVQSFRYLFSFGSGGGETFRTATNLETVASENESQVRISGENTSISRPSEEPTTFRLLEDTESVENATLPTRKNSMEGDQKTPEGPPELAEMEHDRLDDVGPASVTETLTGQHQHCHVEQSRTCAFGEESESEILALAMSFCGADSSIEELEKEWFEGGQREAMREELKRKRYKRLRGRKLGQPS